MRGRAGAAALGVFAALAISACGQKGALYLPDKVQTVVPQSRSKSVSPAPANTPPASSDSGAAPGQAPSDAPPDRAPPNTTDQDKNKVSPKPQ